MAEGGSWRYLRLGPDASVSLFVKATFDTDSYLVVLTDLTNVWQETINEPELLDRADSDGCSINPREDIAQLPILLNKIRDTLNGQEGASVTIESQSSTKDMLQLCVTAPLPASLPDLKWRMSLVKESASAIKSQVISPLLLTLHERQAAIEELQSQLHDKDRVISRLLDRLESAGTDLTTVFPGTSNIKVSRKGSQRAQMARHVKGLTEFDAEQWHPSPEAISDAYTLLDEVRDPTTNETSHLARLLGPASDDWWLSLASHDEKHVSSINKRPNGLEPSHLDEEETDDEDFQVQRIPDRPNSRHTTPSTTASKTTGRIRAASLATTTPSPAPVEIPIGQGTSGASKSRIGVIGGLTKKSTPQPEIHVPASTHDLEETVSRPVRAQITKLGTIGGPRNQASKCQHDPPAQSSKSSEARESSIKPQTLGSAPRDGSHDQQQDKQQDQSDHARVRRLKHQADMSTARAKEDRVPRETSQERANRRREDLKRQLDAQQAPTTQKKKRKF